MDAEVMKMIEEEKAREEKEISLKKENSEINIFHQANGNVSISKEKDNIDEIVDKTLEQGLRYKIGTDKKVQEKILKTSDIIIDSKLGTQQSKAEKQDKESYQQNHKDACDLYGIDEKTVPKWVVNIAVKVQNFWYAFWLIVGFFTTAPVVFLSKKIKVVFKKTWVAVALALTIYLSIILVPILINIIK